MLNCKDCIKNDVCVKKNVTNELWERMQLNPDFQRLVNSGSFIDIDCNNFRGKTATIYKSRGLQ